MNDQTPLPAPGWYADPASPETTLRYWDGADWTEHVHPLEPQAPDAAAGPTAGTAQEPSIAAESSAAEQAAAEARRAGTGIAAGPGAVAESAPSEPAPDVAVPSAEDVTPARFDDAESPQEPATEPAAEQEGDAASPATPAEAAPPTEPRASDERAPAPGASEPAAPAAAPQTDRPDPYAAQQPDPAEQQQPAPFGQPQTPYGQQASANPYAAAPQPGQGASQPPTAPWAQGPGNPYQQPQPAQYGAQPGAPKSRKGLWIGLGIGGGVFLLLVIGIIVAVVAFFASVRQSIDSYEPPVAPPFGAEEPPGTEAPEIEGEVHAMGEAFVVPDPFSSDGSGWELTVTDFSAEAAEAVSAAPGNKGFAVLVQATNLGAEAADPYFGLTPTFVGSDGLEYVDGEQIAPSLYDVDSIDAGATTQFTFTFEVPEDLADGGTVVIYDGFRQASFAVEVG